MGGTMFEDDFTATGFGSYLAMPILRNEWRPDLSLEEAKALVVKCLQVCFYRDSVPTSRSTSVFAPATQSPSVSPSQWNISGATQLGLRSGWKTLALLRTPGESSGMVGI